MRKSSTSGVLRKTLTYDVPIARIVGTGATRMAASSVPRRRAMTADTTSSFSVSPKARRMSGRWSMRTSTSGRSLLDHGRAGRGNACGGPGRPAPPARGPSGAGVDGRGLGRLDARLAERLVERVLPGAVREGILQGLGDE